MIWSGRLRAHRDQGMSIAEVPAPEPIQIEGLIASIGLEPLLAHTVRTVTQAQQERAANIPAEIDRKLYRFINREEREPVADLPAFDFDAVTALIDGEAQPVDKEKLMAAFGNNGDMALAVSVNVDALRERLKTKIPRAFHMSLSGPEHVPPAPSERFRFRRLWNIANDPLSILDDLNEYAVSRDQAAALAELYPTIFSLLWPAVQAALARKKTAAPSWQCGRQKELLLRIITQHEDDSLVLGRAMQEMYAAEAEASKPLPPKASKKPTGASNESTAAQRIDQV